MTTNNILDFAWPTSPQQLIDTRLNPDTFTALDGSGFTPTGMYVNHPLMGNLWAISNQIFFVLNQRKQAMDAVRAELGLRLGTTYSWPQSVEQLRSWNLAPDTFEPLKDPRIPTSTGIIMTSPNAGRIIELSNQAADLFDQRTTLMKRIVEDSKKYFGQISFQMPVQTAPMQPAPAQSIPVQTTVPIQAVPQRQSQFRPQPQLTQTLPPYRQQSIPQTASRGIALNTQILLLVLGIVLVSLAVAVFGVLAYSLMDDTGRAIGIGAVGVISLVISWFVAKKLRVTAEGLGWLGAAIVAIDAGFVSNVILNNQQGAFLMCMIIATLVVAGYSNACTYTRRALKAGPLALTVLIPITLIGGLALCSGSWTQGGYHYDFYLAALLAQVGCAIVACTYGLLKNMKWVHTEYKQYAGTLIRVIVIASVVIEAILSIASLTYGIMRPLLSPDDFEKIEVLSSTSASLISIGLFAVIGVVSLWFTDFQLPWLAPAAVLWLAIDAASLIQEDSVSLAAIIALAVLTAFTYVVDNAKSNKENPVPEFWSKTRVKHFTMLRSVHLLGMWFGGVLVMLMLFGKSFEGMTLVASCALAACVLVIWRMVVFSAASRSTRMVADIVVMLCIYVFVLIIPRSTLGEHSGIGAENIYAFISLIIFSVGYFVFCFLPRQVSASNKSAGNKAIRVYARKYVTDVPAEQAPTQAQYVFANNGLQAPISTRVTIEELNQRADRGYTGIYFDSREYTVFTYAFALGISLSVISVMGVQFSRAIYDLVLVIILGAMAALFVKKINDSLTFEQILPGIHEGIATTISAIIIFLVWVSSANYMPVDLPLIIISCAWLVNGYIAMSRNIMLRSWRGVGYPLIALLVPSLIINMTFAPHTIRAIFVFILAIAAIIYGAVQRWNAPITVGAVVLIAHVVAQTWSYLVAFSQQNWWVWLALGGLVLILAAARYEKLKLAGRNFSELR